MLAFFAFTPTAFAEVARTGTLRICSVLADGTTGVLSSSNATVPAGHFSLSLATTSDFSSPVVNHVFDAQAFAHNTTIDGVPMHCTTPVSVPFGQYYYNNVSMSETAWSPSRYFDSASTFSLSNATHYTDGLFTTDTSDDILINTISDGLVVVNDTTSDRTVIVLNTFAPVLESIVPPVDTRPIRITPPAQCLPGVNMISNSSFETPVVNHPLKWTSIILDTPDFFWTSLDTVVYPYIELQAGYTEGTTQWTAYTGTQYAEIDGGTNHDVSQVLATIPGNTYTLSYWLSPRPNQTVETNVMNVFANGVQIDTYTGAGLETTSWSQKTVTFTATTTQTRISFTQGQNLHIGEGVFLDDVSVTCEGPVIVPPPVNACMIFSDTTTSVVGAGNAVATYDDNTSWTASIPGATWIWSTYKVVDPGATTTVVFSKTFTATSTLPHALLSISSDNLFVVKVNGTVVAENLGEFNYSSVATYDIASAIVAGTNTLTFEVTNFAKPGTTPEINPAGLLYSLDLSNNGTVIGCGGVAPVNTAPVITLVGSNPINLTVGTTFTDLGATAQDAEDGNITHKIVVTGAVNSQVLGTYILTYTVTDSGGLTATTTREVVVLPVPSNACILVSDTTNYVGTIPAVATYNENLAWTVSIPGATWIWSTYKVVDSEATTTVVFSKTFTATSTLNHAILSIAADNSYLVKVNGVTVASNLDEVNFTSIATYDIASAIVAGNNILTIEVVNFSKQGSSPELNPAGLLYKLDLSAGCTNISVNTPPTITLVGANPANLTEGQPWVEPGATANDREDGIITHKIVITGTVNTAVVGTYPLVYTVTDSGGLSASTTRQVIVSPAGGGVTTGSITFCSIYANKDNIIATSATGLPAGTFVIKLASTTDIANSTLQSKTWTASSFAPNKKVISAVTDADCVTYSDLALGTYYYSELSVSGQQWIVSTTSPRYNDQLTTPVNNIFDFFAYSPALFTATTTDDTSRNVNSDGQIIISADRREHTLVMLTQYDAATTTPPIEPPACTANCGGGGGGGGGGNGPIVSSLAITNEKVVEITPGVALVTWNTNLPATKEVGYGNVSQPASFIVAPFGYATSTARVSSPLQTIHSYTIAIEKGKTYYFRPVSTDFKTTVAGIELVLNPGTSTGGNGGGTPTSCYYLFDWLKKGWNNNPVEVKKLQVFLRDLEGYPVEVTGVYDVQTITSLNAFQMRYKGDVLTPWGHSAPTSFTYITTKKKVNEIYCKMAFPVTALEQKEIDAYRAFLQGLSNAGVTITPPTVEQIDAPVFIDTTDVGVLPGLSTSTPGIGQGTLTGAEANSTSTIGRITANVIASSKKMGNFMVALFTWPWDWAKGWFGGNDDLECAPTSVFSNWFNWILVIIILTMAYLWYRERRENKKAAKLNEELELLNK